MMLDRVFSIMSKERWSGRPIVSELLQITFEGRHIPPIICSLFSRVTPSVIVEGELNYGFTVICNGK